MTVVEQLEEKIVAVEHLSAEANELRGKLDAAEKAAKEAEAVRLEFERELSAKLAAANAELADAKQLLADEQAKHRQTKDALEKAREALANPAFADAGTRGVISPTAEGGVPPGEPPMTQEKALFEYRKLRDPIAKAIFRREHAAELGIS